MTGMNRVLFAAWVAAIVVFLGLALGGAGDLVRLYYSNAVQTLTAIGAGLLCFATMESFPKDSPVRKAWGFIGAGTVAWGIGSAIFAGYPLINAGAETPYPYFSDIGFLLTTPLIVAGLYIFRKEVGLELSTMGLALAIVLLVVGGYWGFVANGDDLVGGPFLTKVTALGYMLADPVLLAMTALIATSFRGGAMGKAWLMLLVGLVLFVIGNQVYAYLVSIEAYRTGSLWDLCWIVGFGLVGCGAVATRRLLT